MDICLQRSFAKAA